MQTYYFTVMLSKRFQLPLALSASAGVGETLLIRTARNHFKSLHSMKNDFDNSHQESPEISRRTWVDCELSDGQTNWHRRRQADKQTDNSRRRGESICVFEQRKSSKNNIAVNKAQRLSEDTLSALSMLNRLIHVMENTKYRGSEGDTKGRREKRSANQTRLGRKVESFIMHSDCWQQHH